MVVAARGIGGDGGAQGEVFFVRGLVGRQGQGLQRGTRRAGWDGGQGKGGSGPLPHRERGGQSGGVGRAVGRGVERKVGYAGGGQPVGMDAGMVGGGGAVVARDAASARAGAGGHGMSGPFWREG